MAYSQDGQWLGATLPMLIFSKWAARHGTSTALARHGEARHYAARRPAVPCLTVPPCLSGSPGTTLWRGNRAVPCQQARWHASARAGPDTKHILTKALEKQKQSKHTRVKKIGIWEHVQWLPH